MSEEERRKTDQNKGQTEGWKARINEGRKEMKDWNWIE